jgi:hypothetical protein
MTQLKLHGFGDQPNATPTDFKVYGSNNDSNWTEVLSETGVTVARDTIGSLYTADDTTTAYKYFGLVVTRTAANSYYVGIQEIEYLGTGVGSIPLQIGGGNIDKVANLGSTTSSWVRTKPSRFGMPKRTSSAGRNPR